MLSCLVLRDAPNSPYTCYNNVNITSPRYAPAVLLQKRHGGIPDGNTDPVAAGRAQLESCHAAQLYAGPKQTQ
jgi:hypothetical protein